MNSVSEIDSDRLATVLVSSMKVKVVCRGNYINSILNINPLSYQDSLKKAFDKIENNSIVSSRLAGKMAGIMQIFYGK